MECAVGTKARLQGLASLDLDLRGLILCLFPVNFTVPSATPGWGLSWGGLFSLP